MSGWDHDRAFAALAGEHAAAKRLGVFGTPSLVFDQERTVFVKLGSVPTADRAWPLWDQVHAHPGCAGSVGVAPRESRGQGREVRQRLVAVGGDAAAMSAASAAGGCAAPMTWRSSRSSAAATPPTRRAGSPISSATSSGRGAYWFPKFPLEGHLLWARRLPSGGTHRQATRAKRQGQEWGGVWRCVADARGVALHRRSPR